MKLGAILGMIISMVALTGTAGADAGLTVSASFSPEGSRIGEVSVLAVDARIPKGYHLYAMKQVKGGPLPLKLALDTAGRLEPLTDWAAPPPETEMDENFKKEVAYYEGRVVHRRAYRVTGNERGEIAFPLVVKGQICNEDRCVPFKKPLTANLTIEDGDARPERTKVPALEGAALGSEEDSPPLGEGFIGFIIIAFLAGLGALVTPCVFPMIPITVSFFSKYAKVSMRRSVTMAAVYAGSIVLTFTLIGVVVSAIFGAVTMQSLSASPLFNLFLTLLLVVFAFNLFGLFEIQMPSWLISRTSEKERALSGEEGSFRAQAAGVFFMALTFTLVSFTCTVGFIGIVLAEASKGHWFYPAVGMLAFSVAFSLPFFFLAVFPSWAEKLQGKGGDWMVAVKVVLGFLELAGAFKFLSNVDLVWQWGVVTRPMVLALWGGIFATGALYLFRVFNLPHSDPEVRRVGPVRMFFAIIMLALAVYSAAGIRDQKSMGGWLDGWLPPAVYPGTEAEASSAGAESLKWIVNDIQGGMTRAKAEAKPLFVDFTGYTCTNCRYMEGAVFPKKEVQRRLEKMVLVSAYTDCEDPVCETQREYQLKRFDTAALPFYAIIDPFDDTVLARHPDMTKDIEEYLSFLDEGLDEFARRHPAAPPEPPEEAPEPAPAEAKPQAPEAPALTRTGRPVDFELPSLADGEKTKLSSFRGRWVLLNFWASWCTPCLKELKEEFPPALATTDRVTLVTVAFDSAETKAAAAAFAEKAGLGKTPILLGGEDITEAGLAPAFEVTENLPITYLIDPEGRITWQHRGAVTKAQLIALFAKIPAPFDAADKPF
jgi:thiol:disulfide interchange protein